MEIALGPSNATQVTDIYTEDVLLCPLFTHRLKFIEGDNLGRVVNMVTMGLPLASSMEP